MIACFRLVKMLLGEHVIVGFLIWLIYECHDCEGVLSCAKHSVKSFMKWLVIVGSCVSIMTSFVLPSATQANIQSPAA